MLNGSGGVLGGCDILWSVAGQLVCRTTAVSSASVERTVTIEVVVAESGGGKAAGGARAPNLLTLLSSADTPLVMSISPPSGSGEGGLDTCIIGTNLLNSGTPTVMLGDAPCVVSDWAQQSDSQICCKSGAHALGSVSVAVHDARSGFSLSLPAFNYVAAPQVASLSPGVGHVGSTVTLSGSGLGEPGIDVTLGGVPCMVQSQSLTSIVCVAGDAPPGEAALAVMVPGLGLAAARLGDPSGIRTLSRGAQWGLTASFPLAADFIYEVAVTSVEPSLGSAIGGALVVIRGGGFNHLQPLSVTVLASGLPCTVISVTSSEIICVSPAIIDAHVDFLTWSTGYEAGGLVVPGARCTSEAACSFNYTAAATPELLTLSPSVGGNGTLLEVYGNRLSSDATQNSVTLGGEPCDVLTAELTESTVKVTCRVRLGVAGVHSVQVRTPTGLAFSQLTFTYDLELRGIMPNSGSLAGGTTISILGDGFPEAADAHFADVSLGAVPCRVVASSHSQLLCTTGAHLPGGGQAAAATVRGVPASLACPAPGCHTFAYAAERTPLLASATLDAQFLSLAGDNFDASAAAHEIWVGSTTCTPASSTGTALTCNLAESLAAGMHPVHVTRAGWGLAQHEYGQVVVEAPLVLHSLSPAMSSLAGGLDVTITGSGFPSDTDGVEVMVCGKMCTVVRSDASECVCSSPSLLPTTEDQTCDVSVQVAHSSTAGTATCVDGGAPVSIVADRVTSTACPGLNARVQAAGSTPGGGSCSMELGDAPLQLPSMGASFCAALLRADDLSVDRVECYAQDELVAAVGFLSLTNAAEEGDVVMLATCGAASPWRSTNMGLQRPLLTLGSALASEGSGEGGWWHSSMASSAFAFIGRKTRGIGGALSEAASSTAAAIASADLSCSEASASSTVLASPYWSWGSPSHVAALAAAPDTQDVSTESAESADLFVLLQERDAAASAAGPTVDSAMAGGTSVLDATGSTTRWHSAAAREVAISVELGMLHRVEGVSLTTSASAVLVLWFDGENGWRRAASEPQVAGAGERTVSLTFGEPTATSRLRLFLSAEVNCAALAGCSSEDGTAAAATQLISVRSLSVVGCKTGVLGALAGGLQYSLAATPALQSIEVVDTSISAATGPAQSSVAGGTEVLLTLSGLSGELDVADVGVRLAGVPCAVLSVLAQNGGHAVLCSSGAHTGGAWSGDVSVHVASMGLAAPAVGVGQFEYVSYWSEPSTWSGGVLPVEGDTVFVPPGKTVILDVSSRLYFLVVQGHLAFARKDLSLDCNFIFVMDGSFSVGTESSPFLQQAQITLWGNPVSKELPVYGAKVIACRRCTLDLHGRPTPVTWTRLDGTAAAGTTSLCFTQSVDWDVGSQVVVTSSSFDMNEAEQRSITSLSASGRCITFDTPLSYEHLGEARIFDGRAVEMRAEVGLLSRNVVVQGDEWSPLDRHGGLIMLYSHEGLYRDNSLVGRMSDIELRYMGQVLMHRSTPAVRPG